MEHQEDEGTVQSDGIIRQVRRNGTSLYVGTAPPFVGRWEVWREGAVLGSGKEANAYDASICAIEVAFRDLTR